MRLSLSELEILESALQDKASIDHDAVIDLLAREISKEISGVRHQLNSAKRWLGVRK